MSSRICAISTNVGSISFRPMLRFIASLFAALSLLATLSGCGSYGPPTPHEAGFGEYCAPLSD